MTFDPYYKWLGIPSEEQPPNHYRLLGIKVFEADPDVISTAADRQMSHIRSFQTGPNAALSQTLLNEISNARVCLLNPKKKEAYDDTLRRELQAAIAHGTPARAKRKYDPLTIGVAGAVVCILAIAVIVAVGVGGIVGAFAYRERVKDKNRQVAAVTDYGRSGTTGPAGAFPPGTK